MSQSPNPQSPPPPESASKEPNLEPEQEPEPEPEPESDPAPMDVAVPEITSGSAQPTRKPANKRKKSKPPSKKYLAMGEQKLSLFEDNLKLVPFSPTSSLPDLSKHESLFRALGLWDFAHLSLDQDLRPDLIASLIAFYDPSARKSLVNGVKISVSRADLARALSLPAKKKTNEEPDHELFGSDEAGSILSEFISSYMLFHLQQDDDACILPQEVAEATQLVKEGQPDKVYWAGLIWGFVEKELQEVLKTRVCYYASHLQQLIKYQQPQLLEQVPVEVKAVPQLVPEAGNSEDVAMEEAKDDEEDEEDDEEEDHLEKTKSLEELVNACGEAEETCGPVAEAEEGCQPVAAPGLGLGLSGEQNSSFEGGPLCWGLTQEKGKTGFEHSLRPCSSSGFGFQSLNKPDMDGTTEVDEEEEEYMHSLQRMDSSTDLLQAMENVNNVNLYSTGSDLNNQELNSGGFLSMSGDPSNSGSYFFPTASKRPLSEIDEEKDEEEDDEEEEEGVAHMQAAKRMRSETDNWNFEQPSAFSTCMARAQALYDEKNQAAINAQMQVQYLSNMIQEKDQVLHQLERSRFEDQQKYHGELSRYEQEMNIMAQLVFGYKQALKQTRQAFSEYRKKYPEGEEKEKPVYGDVPNGGGLVISTKELERQKLEREIEMKQVALGMIGEFQNDWLEKFEGFGARVSELERRVEGFGGGVENFKEKKEVETSLPSAECTEM